MRAFPAVAVLALALTTACTSPAPTPVDETAETAALSESLEAFAEAALADDVEGAAAFLTDDAVIREPGMLLTRSEWMEMVGGMIASGGGVASFEPTVTETFLHGDVAYQIGVFDETLTMGGAAQEILGNFFIRWEKGADGVWRMDRLLTGSRETPGGAPAGEGAPGM